ncbi:hypothetical protein SADUNF_Sadunf14G0023700 [Salix dunnii]|uniref:Uncharacterized protein n=1 Tax=Salix dunnii TaxID=1413687 RepID=A0A835MK14_9ROSI|nr:hypothetical protein SADUNF_Sadunf14G0023700 [Salix dunnii]
MTTTRLLRSSKLLHHVAPPNTTSSPFTTVKCVGKATGFNGDKMVSGDHGDHKRKSTVAVKASVAASKGSLLTVEPPRIFERGLIDLASLLAMVSNALRKVLRPPALKPKLWKFQVQKLIEKAIIDCRFFTLFAVAGSLLGSALCFVEGCFLILESYFQYFNTLYRVSDQGHLVHLLIEAIDMFLVGTAMLIFGVGLYVMFVGSKNPKDQALSLPDSNLFGLFSLKSLPTWFEMRSVSQAKSKIGHAIMMILQVGMLEKFKSIPLATSVDLACFAGAVLFSSACIFLLSRLSLGAVEDI